MVATKMTLNKVKMSWSLAWFSLLLLFVGASCQENSTDSESRKRMFSFLQVMKFPNDVCAGTSRNGTCYSSDECTSKGGTASGSCANGFGVCCVFQLACGQSSSENNTYLLMASTTNPSISNCIYSLCEASPNVCRIRLDFTSFTINGPAVGTANSDVTTNGGAIGDCVSDSFYVSSPGNRGSPVICGVNTGQHMYIDSSSICMKAVFNFGSAIVARSYDIKVTQYNCGDEMAGPSDCLQYFTTPTGTFTSFNFFLTNNAVIKTVTHLSNQNYDICFRRNAGACAICYSPTVNPVAPALDDQISFGVSNAAADAANGEINAACSTDYLSIPSAVAASATALNAGGVEAGARAERLCGRSFNSAGGATAAATVCTGHRPFKVSFRTDDNEVVNNAGDFTNNEQHGITSGFVGFSLNFFSVGC